MMSIIWQSMLFIWFIFSIYLVATDNNLTPLLRMVGQGINLLSMAFLAANMVSEIQNVNTQDIGSSILYLSVNCILLAWYIYYTPIDFKATDYTPVEKIAYCAIDIAMVLYLLTTLLGMLLIKAIQPRLNIANQ